MMLFGECDERQDCVCDVCSQRVGIEPEANHGAMMYLRTDILSTYMYMYICIHIYIYTYIVIIDCQYAFSMYRHLYGSICIHKDYMFCQMCISM